MSFDSIQAEDDSTSEAVVNTLKKKTREHRHRLNLEAEAHVRKLVAAAEEAIVGESELEPERCLQELHWCLRLDERLQEVLSPDNDGLEPAHKMRFRRHARARNRQTHPEPMQEFRTAIEVAVALGYMHSYSDRTMYAPVRLKPIKSSFVDDIEEVTPIARRRIGHKSESDLTDVAIDIDHSSCEHFLNIALPRQGKDSTSCRLIANLVSQHGYKAFSLYDDGRNETPMWGIPADEPEIKRILQRDFGQEPRAFNTRVYVPSAGNVPEQLPQNFETFTIGLDALTPRIIMRLASVESASPDTERRLAYALRETEQHEGTIQALIQRILDLAEETEASITVTELLDDAELEERQTQSETVSYVMDEDKYLNEIAKSLTMLAGDGLIGDVGQESNLDLVDEFRHQNRIAVLNCNYLESHNRYLKYVLINVWLNLIYQLRDDDTLRLPRAVVELREIKNLAPSVMGNARYSNIIKSLSQTLYMIGSQGGSRRLLMVGSAQKQNDVLKALRQNMPNKIILQVSDEEVKTLDKSMQLNPHEEEQLRTFKTGWGMLYTDGDRYYPLQFCPAVNGMGLGDENWKDRYGRAMGARVPVFSPLPEGADRWVDMAGELHEPEELAEGDWYLLPRDLPAGALEERPVSSEDIQQALEERREHPLPQELHLEETSVGETQRTINLQRADNAEEQRWQEIQQQHDIPPVLSDWARMSEDKRERMLSVLRVIGGHELESQREVGDHVGVSGSAVGNYLNKDSELGACVSGTDFGEQLELTPVGEQALRIPWGELELE